MNIPTSPSRPSEVKTKSAQELNNQELNNSEKLMQWLKNNNLDFNCYNHEPLFTTKDVDAVKYLFPANSLSHSPKHGYTKNLFLVDRKKNYYLLSCLDCRKLELNKLAKLLGHSRFSFSSPERLQQVLNLKPGSVSPLSLKDSTHPVQLYLDKELTMVDKVYYHPLDNTKTLAISPTTMNKFYKLIEQKLCIIDFNSISNSNP